MTHLFEKLLLALAALATLLVTPVQARDQATQPAPAPEQAVTVHASPALWKVADEDTTIYLFGTIHVLPEGIAWFDGKIAAAFGEADTLVTEIVETDAATMQSLIARKALLPADQTLRQLLSDDERAAYEQALGGLRVPAPMFDRFKPWYAAVALSTLPLIQEGFASEHGVEAALEAKAKARQLAHRGLETPEYQLALFDGLPLDVQQIYLAEVVEQLPRIRTELRAMVEAWAQGDAARLARLMNIEQSNPVLVKTLLVDRNKHWAAWIHSRLAEPGTVFLAVGAGHLGGPGSLQEQLAARELAVERLQ